MKTTTKTCTTLMEMDRIIKELGDAGFENLGSWEFYSEKLDTLVILKLKLDK